MRQRENVFRFKGDLPLSPMTAKEVNDMQSRASINELSWHANVNTYNFDGKCIVLYDDHRYILNALFEAEKLGLWNAIIPNLIFFDRHDDARAPATSTNLNTLLQKWNASKLTSVASEPFWSFVDFELSNNDDDWLLTGMELGLINHAVVIGNTENNNIERMNNQFHSSNGILHKLYNIPHLHDALSPRGGCLGDIALQSQYADLHEIFEFEYDQSCRCYRFPEKIINPFVLDFDLDCFSTEYEDMTFAWPEVLFKEKYVSDQSVYGFMRDLIQRSSLITICREPECCGGLGESNRILGYLDRYFFEGCLKTRFVW